MKNFNKLLFILFLSMGWLNYAAAQYCAGGPSSTEDSNIESVSLTGDNLTITHVDCNGPSGEGGTIGTQDLTHLLADLTTGSSYTVDVTFGSCDVNGTNWAGVGEVWIDWNADMTFQPTESIGTWVGTGPAPTAFAFTVPATAVTGITRMRTMQWETGTISNPLDPCGTYTWGAVMDFSIAVNVTCLPPGGATFTNAMPTSIDMAFNSVSGLTNVEYGVAGFTPGTGTTMSGVTGTQTFSSLTANTAYDVYLTDDCGAGSLSPVAGPFQFATSCVTFIAPYTESFETLTSACWVQDAADQEDWSFGTGGTPSFNTGPTGDHTPGAGGAGTYIFVEGNNATAGDIANLSTTVDLSGVTSPYLEFWYHMFGTGIGTLNVDIELGGIWINVWTLSGDQGDQWSLGEVSLAPFTGQTVNVRVQVIGAASTLDDIALDDIRFREAPTCLKPTNLAVSAILATSVDLTWSSNSGMSNVEYGAPGFTPGTGTVITGIASPYTLMGLNSNTAYDIYMIDSCGLGDLSDPITTSFLTQCVSFAAPYIETWETLSNVCWTQDAADDRDWVFDQSGTPSTQTGPSGDHTFGLNGAGTYIFLETSGVAAGQTANLTAPIDLSALTTPFVSFYYHMYGTTMGTLNIDVEFPLGSGNWVNVWTLSGDQGDQWLEGEINLGGLGITGQIGMRLQAISGGSYRSDMALDDIEFKEAPTCPKPSSLAVSNITATTADLTWTSFSGMSDIEYGPQGFTPGTGTVVTNLTSPYTIPGLVGNTGYDVYLIDSCGLGDVSEFIFTSFVTSCVTFVAPYLENFETLANVCWIQDQLDQNDWVFLQGATGSANTGPSDDHTLGAGGNGTYIYLESPVSGNIANLTTTVDVSGLTVPHLQFWYHMFGNNTGTLNVDVEFPVGSGIFINVWTLTGAQGNQWLEADVSLAAYTGQTIGVRLQAISGGFTTSDMAIDDVHFREAPACIKPTNLATANLTALSTDISWSSTSGLSNVEYGPSGFFPGSGTLLTGVTSPQSISGLSPTTSYDVYIVDDCIAAGNGVSDTATISFTTLIQGAQGITCTTLGATSSIIFTENFENNNAGWTGDVGTGNGNWEIPDGAGSTNTGADDGYLGGRYMNYEASSTVANQGSIVSPPIDLTAGVDDAELSFWIHAFGADMGTLEVGVGTSPTGPFTTEFTWTGQLQTAGSDPWQNAGVSLTTYIGQTIYVQFTQFDGAGFAGDMSIDLMEVSICQTCPTPSNLMISNVTSTGADIDWTTANTGTYDIVVVPSGMPIDSGTVVNTASLPYSITGLNVCSSYDVYASDNCGGGDVSNAITGFFTTLPGIVAAPFTESFENGGTLNPCWTQSAADAFDWTVEQGPTGSGNTGPSGAANGSFYLYIETSNPIAAGDSAILESPEIDLSALSGANLNFSYHMYGTTTGTLDVEVESPVGSGTWTNIWTLSGDQGDQWYTGSASLTPYGPNLKLRFIGISGGLFTSDIAIDNISVMAPPPAELSVLAIDAGQTGCGLSNEAVTISVTNNGASTVTSFDAGFNNNGSIVSEVANIAVAPNDTIDYTFTSQANFSAAGTYQVTAYVTAVGDPNASNDTITTSISNSPLVSGLPYNMSWENGAAGWSADGDWQLGMPNAPIIDTASAGMSAWVTNLTGIYSNNSLAYLSSPCFDFSGETADPVLSVDVWYDTETDWDGGYVEVSTNGGATWAKLGTVEPNWYNNNNTNGTAGDSWNGSPGSLGWVTMTHTLDGTAGASDAKVRFVMESDGTQTDEGLGIDNLSITAAVSCPADLGLAIMGTDETTAGSGNGSATVSASGGMSPYTYMWTTNDTSTMIMNLTSGDYGVVVTDANGCEDSTGVTISVLCPANLGLSTTASPETGVGTNTGTATVTATGGTAPYTYSWSNGSTNGFAGGLAGDSATYTVTVTDANGCTDMITATIGTVFLTATNEIEGLRGIALTPNPTMDVTLLQVEFEKAIDLTIEVIDITGKVLQTRQEGQVVSEQFRLDLSKYAAGTYFIKLSANGQVVTRPVVLMK